MHFTGCNKVFNCMPHSCYLQIIVFLFIVLHIAALFFYKPMFQLELSRIFLKMPNQKPFTCIEVRQEYNDQKDKQ
jgi:hypothetical protein